MATHSLYEVLTRLTERVTWPSEAEKVQVLASIREAELEAAMGVRVTEIACAHESIRDRWGRPTGTCEKCGKVGIA